MPVKRKGFTLVELLIVIVVIGILSAMMMLSSTEAVSSARANNIISDMRNLKTAALSFYADHIDAVQYSKQFSQFYIDRSTLGVTSNNDSQNSSIQNTVQQKPTLITDYLGSGEKVSFQKGDGNFCTKGGFAIINEGEKPYKKWFIVYRFPDNYDNVKAKLAGKAKSVGLIGGERKNENIYENGDYVYMKVLQLAD